MFVDVQWEWESKHTSKVSSFKMIGGEVGKFSRTPKFKKEKREKKQKKAKGDDWHSHKLTEVKQNYIK